MRCGHCNAEIEDGLDVCSICEGDICFECGAAVGPDDTACPQCGAAQQSHRACPSCGFYGGRQVVTVEAHRPLFEER